jgi:hypothetical protein
MKELGVVLPNHLLMMWLITTNIRWNELPNEYKKALPSPTYVEKFENTRSGRKTRYHLNQTMCLFRMSPSISDYAASMRKQVLDSIFEAIVSRIQS